MGSSEHDHPPDSAPTRQYPAPGPLSRGTILAGKYRIERALGAGGMALVVEATHMTLGRRVAIKVLQGEAAVAPEVLSRFQREAQIAAQLPGEHIARVSDVGRLETGEPYLVMELLVGRDLDAELQVRGRLGVEEAVDLVLQACEGVAEAHGAGLVHRDLKPGNLFLTRRRDGTPVIKVLDFGISKAAPGGTDQSLTKTTSTFGTPLYMSPEQVQSAKHVDHRSDQHALAAILYALLTGRPPFEADSLTALAVLIATEPPRPVRETRPEVPPELDAAIERALAKRPGDRYPDLTGFAQAIARFGSADSMSSVSCISQALSHPPPGQTGPLLFSQSTEGPIAAGPSAQAQSVQTSPGLSTGIARDLASRRRVVLGVAVAAGLLGLGGVVAIALMVSRGQRSAEVAPDPIASATAPAAPTDPTAIPTQPPSTGPIVTPSDREPTPTTTPTPKSPDKTDKTTDAHTSAPGPPATSTAKKKPPPIPSTKRPTDVFGTRR